MKKLMIAIVAGMLSMSVGAYAGEMDKKDTKSKGDAMKSDTAKDKTDMAKDKSKKKEEKK